MMGGHHAVSGAAAWLAITATAPAIPVAAHSFTLTTGLYAQTPAVALIGALLVAGWALAADADHHSATIAHSVPVVGRIVTGAVEEASGGHRKGTHTIWAVLAVAALSWFAGLFVWRSQGPIGPVDVGLLALTVPVTAFAAHAMKLPGIGHSWPRSWIAGGVLGAVVTIALRQDVPWLPVAVVLGYTVHLAGDLLTAEGLAPLYPILIRPPKAIANLPVLSAMWHENGYVSIPLLGKTGSAREWLLAALLSAYVAYVAFYEIQQLVGIHL